MECLVPASQVFIFILFYLFILLFLCEKPFSYTSDLFISCHVQHNSQMPTGKSNRNIY